MSSFSVCSQCMQAVRRSARPERMIRTFTPSRIAIPSRLLSTSSRSLQKEKEAPPDPGLNTEPPPFTAGTVTTNVTAARPENTPTEVETEPESKPESKPDSKHSNLSTAEIQRHLASNLGRSRGAALTDKLARTLRKTATATTETYITYGLTEAYFKSCAAQAPYTIPEDQRNQILTSKGPTKTAEGEDLGVAQKDTFWFRELELEPTFSTWSQVTYLHMYILTVRLRAMEDQNQFRDYQRYLIEHFSNAAEDKMAIEHVMGARGIRNRYLKDLFVQWRGCLAAYDEGMVKGDAVLAGAVWRNIWKGREDVDWGKVAVVVVYMRKAIQALGNVSFEELAANLDGGINVWENARMGIMSSVTQRSKGMTEPL